MASYSENFILVASIFLMLFKGVLIFLYICCIKQPRQYYTKLHVWSLMFILGECVCHEA
jgi:hypothetical protein